MNSHNLPFDASLEAAIKRGYAFASTSKHEFFTLEHLLWGSIAIPLVAEMLRAMNVNLEDLRADLERKIEENTPVIGESDPAWSRTITRVLHRAVEQASSSSAKSVSIWPVLINLLEEEESYASYFLKNRDVTPLMVRLYASHGLAGLNGVVQSSSVSPVSATNGRMPHSLDNPPAQENGYSDILNAYTVDLNAKASAGLIDPLIGRTNEIRRTAQVLSRRRKNNPLLVGEAGVGKTAIAEGLARLIVDGKAPEALSGKRVLSLEVASLLAGTKYRGDFEQRIKDVLSEVKKDPNILLFVDEIHTLVGAGAGSGSLDASNIIKPALASGELRLIGATTFDEYRNVFEKEKALDRRFLKIDVSEPTEDETLAILQGVRKSLEAHHQVRYTTEALRSAIDLSVRYQPSKHLPDKAIDLLDEAGAVEKISGATRRKTIDRVQIERVISEIVKIPIGQVSHDSLDGLRKLGESLNGQIFGQPHAIDTLVNAVQVSKAGLNDPNKPLGSFLFSGPTGVGKTEVTRVLSSSLDVPLIRFDMSEYMEAHAVASLVGAPPGYVGHDKGGLLTDSVYRNPHCVLLLDEVEKAHPDILNILLQVFDHGVLTDSNGRKVDFRHAFIIMTTNAGASVASRPTMGFVRANHASDGTQALERSFPPELRNRLDAIVAFKSLTPEAIYRVVDKNVVALEVLLKEQGVSLVVGPGARAQLAKEGYVPEMGARPMARLFNEKIKKALATKMLFGNLSQGGLVEVDVNDLGEWVWTESPVSMVVPDEKAPPKSRRRVSVNELK